MGAPASVADAGSSSCDAGGCTTSPCEPGGLRCTGAALEECAADGQSWIARESCANGCLCELGLATGSCAPPGCVTGETRCSGALLELCNACQTGFELLADCGSAEACNALTQRCELGGSEGEPGGETETAPGGAISGSDAGAP